MKLRDLQIDPDRLAEICRRYHVVKLEAFGSFARDEAHEGSDLDILASFEAGGAPGLEFVALAQELEALFSRRVDLFTRQSVEQAENKYFRRYALEDVQVLYERAA